MRIRKFDPQKFFLSLIYLVSSDHGYPSALRKAWADFDLHQFEPVKSSLSKIRQKISYRFFEEIFAEMTRAARYRKTYRGLFVYAVDGHETTLPASEQVLADGFRGRARMRRKETYYPRMYLSEMFDVINELTVSIEHNATRNENRDALKLLEEAEKNSLTIYDRAYLCRDLLNAHFEKGSFFLFRCRSGATFKEVRDFYKSRKEKAKWTYSGQVIRLVKIRNPRTKQKMVLATNLPRSWKEEELKNLYQKRWSIETSYRDAVYQGLDHWHSKSQNGILQELYARLCLMNFARIQILRSLKASDIDPLGTKYRKTNFKLLVNCVIDLIPLLLRGQLRKALERINDVIRRNRQARERLTRNYPRAIKASRKTAYPRLNVIKRRPQ